jgi:DNA helicase-2/ATP-dependent DNA helicase PcrA
VGRVGTAAMTLGGVFHDVLEAFHDPERLEEQTLERLLALADEKWDSGETRPRALAVQNKRLLERMLRNYYEWEVTRGRVGEVLAVEQRFQLALDSSTFTGYIDRIDRRTDGRLCLFDYKTSKWPMSLDEAEQDLQLALYALACHDLPELAAFGEVAELTYLYPRDVKASGLTRRSQTVTSDLTEATRNRMREDVAAIVGERFDFSPDADCQWCDFKRVCPRHFGGDVPL